MRRPSLRMFLLVLLAAAALGGAGAACNTPQIPITPSLVPTDTIAVTDLGGGQYQLHGLKSVDAGDQVYVLDRMNMQGVFTTADSTGSFTTGPLLATPGDLLELWYYDVDKAVESPHDCAPLKVGASLGTQQTCP